MAKNFDDYLAKLPESEQAAVKSRGAELIAEEAKSRTVKVAITVVLYGEVELPAGASVAQLTLGLDKSRIRVFDSELNPLEGEIAGYETVGVGEDDTEWEDEE